MTRAADSSPGPVALVGGRGYLGAHLAEQLRAAHVPFWVVGRQPASLPRAAGFDYRSAVPTLDAALAGARVVVHLATLSTPSLGEKNPQLEVENLRFALELIAACRREKVQRIVFASSGGTIYGETALRPAVETDLPHPSCAHAVTKLAIEHHLRIATEEGPFAATALRLTNVYGGSQSVKGEQGVVSYLLHQLAARQEISLLGDTIRDYVHVADASAAFLRAIEDSRAGFGVFNISSGVGTSLTQLATQLCALMGQPPHFRMRERRPFDLACNVLANEAARAHLGWTPAIPLAEGLRRAVSEFQARSL